MVDKYSLIEKTVNFLLSLKKQKGICYLLKRIREETDPLYTNIYRKWPICIATARLKYYGTDYSIESDVYLEKPFFFRDTGQLSCVNIQYINVLIKPNIVLEVPRWEESLLALLPSVSKGLGTMLLKLFCCSLLHLEVQGYDHAEQTRVGKLLS